MRRKASLIFPQNKQKYHVSALICLTKTKQIMNFRTFRIAAISVLFASFSATSLAQDLIARQAPIDRRQKAADSLALQRMIQQEAVAQPATDLYNSWNTSRVFCYSENEVPETFKIDLRGFHLPTTSRIVTSHVGYRPRFRRVHKGLDIKVYTGDTIYAAFDGRVRMTDYQPKGYGNVVVIRHGNGLETIYGHLSQHLCREGDQVRAGQPIGLGGNTGASYGSHLHFETRLVGAMIDPELLFDFPNQDIKCDYYVFRKNGNGETGAKTQAVYEALPQGRGEQVLAATTRTQEASFPEADPSRVQLQGKFHKVSPGETVSSIARRLDISVETLCNANHISRNTHVRPGQILRY